MVVTIEPVSLLNLDEEMGICYEDVPPERKLKFERYVQAKRDWFKSVSERYGVCGFLAYLDGNPVGMVEFLPVDAVPYPNERPEHTVFILCAWVKRDEQNKGIGREMLNHLIQYLHNTPFGYFGGRKAAAIEVYVPEFKPRSLSFLQFPTGSREFYEKLGFKLKKKLVEQKGYLYRLELK